MSQINSNATNWFNSGKNKIELEDLQGAIADFTEAIKLKPDFALAYYARGTVKNVLEDYRGAIDDQTKSISLNPTFHNAYLCRGLAYSALNQKKQADSDFLKARELEAAEMGYQIQNPEKIELSESDLIPISDNTSIAEDIENRKLIQGKFGKPFFGQEYIELKFDHSKQLTITANPLFVPLKINFIFNDDNQNIAADQYQSMFNLLPYAKVDKILLPCSMWGDRTSPVTLNLTIDKTMIERNYHNSRMSGKGGYVSFQFFQLQEINKIQLIISADRMDLPMYKIPNPNSVFLSVVFK